MGCADFRKRFFANQGEVSAAYSKNICKRASMQSGGKIVWKDVQQLYVNTP